MTNKLFVVLLGGRGPDDLIEAHNLFIGVGTDLKSLVPHMKGKWPPATHIDAYMVLKCVDGYNITLAPVADPQDKEDAEKLFVVNIGYYIEGHFAEHHKLIPLVLTEGQSVVARMKEDPDFLFGQALNIAARSHIDDKYAVVSSDVDDEIQVQKYVLDFKISLKKVPKEEEQKNVLQIGYIKFSSLVGNPG